MLKKGLGPINNKSPDTIVPGFVLPTAEKPNQFLEDLKKIAALNMSGERFLPKKEI